MQKNTLLLKCDNDANADDAAVSNDDDEENEKDETLMKERQQRNIHCPLLWLLIYSPCRQTLTFSASSSSSQQ